MSEAEPVDLTGLPLTGGIYPDGVEIGLQLELSDEAASVSGELSSGLFVLHTAGDDEPLVGAAAALPLQLARLTSLSPRPYPSADAPVLIADGLPSLDRAGVLAGWSAEDREGTPLAHEEVAVWFAWTSWDGADGRRSTRLVGVADAGSAGIAIIDADEDGVVVKPATATDVWRALTTLLPRPGETPAEPGPDA